MKLTGTHILSMTLALLALLSCTKQASAPAVLTDADAITISDPAFEGEDTKGVDSVTGSNLSSFSIFAIQDYSSAVNNNWYFTETQVSKSGGKWTIAGSPRWPKTGDLSFFFCTPTTSQAGSALVLNLPSSKYMPGLEYTPSTTNIDKQADLCVGQPVMKVTKAGGAVNVNFIHALTQIVFSANYTGNLGKSEFVLIDTIRIRNVVGTKYGQWSSASPYFSWEDETKRTFDSTYELTRVNKHIVQDSLYKSTGKTPDKYYTMSTQDGTLYLLPQDLSGSSSSALDVCFGVYTGAVTSPTLVKKYSASVGFPAKTVWEMGQSLNYNLTISVPDAPAGTVDVKLNCVIGGWTDIHNVIDKNHLE